MTNDQLAKIVRASIDLGSDDLPSWEPAKATLRELLPESVYREVVDNVPWCSEHACDAGVCHARHVVDEGSPLPAPFTPRDPYAGVHRGHMPARPCTAQCDESVRY
jgi:hypothetical protein